jgi:hypothetical protein
MGLNDILRTIDVMRKAVDRLRKREAGMVEGPASGFPHSVGLKNFGRGDRVVVVASGWLDDGSIRPVAVHASVDSGPEGHVLTLVPHAPDGGRIRDETLVHVSWMAMV